jgi:hypothetical protein
MLETWRRFKTYTPLRAQRKKNAATAESTEKRLKGKSHRCRSLKDGIDKNIKGKPLFIYKSTGRLTTEMQRRER